MTEGAGVRPFFICTEPTKKVAKQHHKKLQYRKRYQKKGLLAKIWQSYFFIAEKPKIKNLDI